MDLDFLLTDTYNIRIGVFIIYYKGSQVETLK